MSELTAMGQVTEIGKTQKGKMKFKIGGQWYYEGRALSGSYPNPGQSVEVRYTLFGDKGDLRSLEVWRPVSNGSAPVASVQSATGLDEASLRFISNVVGSAITAGAIKDPGQVNSWFQSAKAALSGKAADIPFDDHIPDEWRQ